MSDETHHTAVILERIDHVRSDLKRLDSKVDTLDSKLDQASDRTSRLEERVQTRSGLAGLGFVVAALYEARKFFGGAG